MEKIDDYHYTLSMQERIDCKYSYGSSDTIALLCQFGFECDGNLYECCLGDEFIEDKVCEMMMRGK